MSSSSFPICHKAVSRPGRICADTRHWRTHLSEGHWFVENFFVHSLADWKTLQSCSYSSMKLIIHTMEPKWSRTLFVFPKFASDHLKSNSSDSFSNFVSTNLPLLMKMIFFIHINNKYKAKTVSWNIRRFVATGNSWNHLTNWIYIAFNYFYNFINVMLSWEANWSALKVFVV